LKRWRWACGGCVIAFVLIIGATLTAGYLLLGSAWEAGRRVTREVRAAFESGEWDDDPANWRRAFGADPPPGWQVIRSRFWRSPHWSREEAYHFHVRIPVSERGPLPRYQETERQECPDPPDWLPKPDPARFEIQHGALLERGSTDVYLFGCQI
jgi:hypothetical protein